MTTLSLPLTLLVRENVSILLAHAFSQQPLEQLLQTSFEGSWDNLRDTVVLMSNQRAEKASLELAIFLRYLDDEQGLSRYVDQRKNFTFGELVVRGKPNDPLTLRDVANKIIHAVSISWDHSAPERPRLVCHARDTEKWEAARIDIVALAAVCGNLAA